MQPDTQVAARQERQEAKIDFIDDYVRHTANILDRVCGPTHPDNDLSPTLPITLPVFGQKSMLAMHQW